MSKNDFRSLQKEWYGKLKSSGFIDIEKFKGEELILSQPANYCIKTLDALTRYMRQEYFSSVSQAVENGETPWRNATDKYILTRYSEGARIKTIVLELQEMREPRHRHTVRYIIRRYEILWGLKTYPPNLLNKYNK